MILELTCRPDRGGPIPFRVEVLHHSLDHLIADAREAYRVYELMMIRRPGDLWKYLWVKILDVPPAVVTRMDTICKSELHHERGSGQASLPLPVFDSLFTWCEDTPPESSCWLTAREAPRFMEYGKGLFQWVRARQDELKKSSDLLIAAETAAITAFTHCHDKDADIPFESTSSDYRSPVMRRRSPAYYDKLLELLALPEVVSVAVEGDDDYHTLRILCTEQRRRSLISGYPPGHDMPLRVVCDNYPSFSRWNAEVACMGEGPGYGDLRVSGNPSGPTLAYWLPKIPSCRMALTHRDEGEIAGFERTAGDGWVLYKDIRPDVDLTLWRQSVLESFQKRVSRRSAQ